VSTEARLAIWFNKRALRLLEFPFPHSFHPMNDGWEIVVLTPGKLVARFLNGEHQRFDVNEGDTLLASREEIYLALTRPGVTEEVPAEVPEGVQDQRERGGHPEIERGSTSQGREPGPQQGEVG
jgi:hypothetical protein